MNDGRGAINILSENKNIKKHDIQFKKTTTKNPQQTQNAQDYLAFNFKKQLFTS